MTSRRKWHFVWLLAMTVVLAFLGTTLLAWGISNAGTKNTIKAGAKLGPMTAVHAITAAVPCYGFAAGCLFVLLRRRNTK